MTQSEFSRKIGVTRQAVSKMAKIGELVLTKDGKINYSESCHRLKKFGKLDSNNKSINSKEAQREDKENKVEGATDWRLKLIEEKALTAELNRRKLEGILIEVSEAKRRADEFISPISRKMDNLAYDFKSKFPLADSDMIKYIQNYTNDIKEDAQKGF